MTPADLITLRQAIRNINHERRSNRMDAEMQFRYLNKKYTRPAVDEAKRKIEEGA